MLARENSNRCEVSFQLSLYVSNILPTRYAEVMHCILSQCSLSQVSLYNLCGSCGIAKSFFFSYFSERCKDKIVIKRTT